MMDNLFSIFDPLTTIFNIPFNWMSALLGLLFFPLKFWFSSNQYNLIFKKISLSLHNEFNMLLGPNKINGSSFIFISLFFMILMNNLLGLIPHIFTASSHLSFTLTLSIPLWISFMIYGWSCNTNHMFIHLVPQSTPIMLTSFMVLIETISNLIRPLTLAVRLTANMIAGHLLLTLLSSCSSILPSYLIILLILTQNLLLVLEIAVAMIQSYVFVTLSNLYSSEVN
uniref:ATP synthase F0 subunit 6 n=1 Tax=Oxyethira ecornuta TaxID=1401674 RepID=UPI0022DCE289|nr:ATP synthase F0 subunit 6 [Oxyethira ecornuta]UZZ44238.1 ATP synthase F0 subunit 6 [Oxyethira ecornuta]